MLKYNWSKVGIRPWLDLSNQYFMCTEFELKYGWSGVLVEAHPTDFIKGRDTNRKTFHVRKNLANVDEKYVDEMKICWRWDET